MLELEGRLTELLSCVVLCSIMYLHSFLNSLADLWILSQRANFAVLRLIFVYPVCMCFVFIIVYYILCYCDMVGWTWWD